MSHSTSPCRYSPTLALPSLSSPSSSNTYSTDRSLFPPLAQGYSHTRSSISMELFVPLHKPRYNSGAPWMSVRTTTSREFCILFFCSKLISPTMHAVVSLVGSSHPSVIENFSLLPIGLRRLFVLLVPNCCQITLIFKDDNPQTPAKSSLYRSLTLAIPEQKEQLKQEKPSCF